MKIDKEFWKIPLEEMQELILKKGLVSIYLETGYHKDNQALISDVLVNPSDALAMKNAIAGYGFGKKKKLVNYSKMTTRNRSSVEMCWLEYGPVEASDMEPGFIYFRKKVKAKNPEFTRFNILGHFKKRIQETEE